MKYTERKEDEKKKRRFTITSTLDWTVALAVAVHVRQWFVTKVQQALSAAGVQGSCFNGHSFRIGVALSAGAAAVPKTVIKALGRWQSSAYQGYIRPTPEELARVATQLAPSSVDPQQDG